MDHRVYVEIVIVNKLRVRVKFIYMKNGRCQQEAIMFPTRNSAGAGAPWSRGLCCKHYPFQNS